MNYPSLITVHLHRCKLQPQSSAAHKLTDDCADQTLRGAPSAGSGGRAPRAACLHPSTGNNDTAARWLAGRTERQPKQPMGATAGVSEPGA